MDSTRKTYIAVIDDDESIRNSMSWLLRAASFHPVVYHCAESFLSDTNRPRFACLLIDIQLRGMSGLELSRLLRAVKDSTPIIIVTAHDNPDNKEKAEAAGCAGYFRKADSGVDILSAIHRLLDAGAGPQEEIRWTRS